MTTTELGINVGTGQSEEELNKLADSMDNVLAKFVQVMETAGRSEEAFQKIAGAVGIHQTKLKAMTDDVKKASMVLGPEIAKTNDMTIRGLSTNITKQFNKLSRDISAVFSIIPQELQKSTQEIANMTVAVNNNLGGIRVQAKEATDALFALATAENKISKSITKPKVVEDTKTTTEMWGTKYNRAQALMEADAWDAAIKSAQKYEVEQAKIKKARDADNTNAVKTAITQYRSDRKDSFNTAAGVVERTEKDTIDYISFVKSKTEAVANTLAEARAKGYIDVEEIKKVQTALTEVNKETKSLSVANKDMSGDAGRAMAELSESVNGVNKDFKTLRDTSKIGFLESLGIDIPKVKDLQESLSGVSQEIKTLQTGKVDLGDLTRLKKELTDISEKSKVIGAKNEEAAAKNLLKTIEDQIKAVELLNKEKDKAKAKIDDLNKEALLYEKVEKAMSDANAIADKLSSKITGIDTGVPIFQDLQGIQKTFTEIEKVKASLKETIVQARKLDDPAQLSNLQEQLKDVLGLEDKIKNAMRGMHPTEVGGISDPTITQFKQEIELLDKIKASLDKVVEAKERLSSSNGSKKYTEEAKRELAHLKEEVAGYKDIKDELKRDLDRLGVRDSQAIRSLNSSFGELSKAVNSLDSQIRGTEKSFKNMWGSVAIGFGKFLLIRHTIGIVFQDIRGLFDLMRTGMSSVMSVSEPITNLEKALRLMNETQGGIAQARSEMSFFKKTANELGFAYKDLAESFKQFKDIADTPGGNYKGIMNIWKEMTAAAKATGQQGDLTDFFKGFTDTIGKGQVMTEELKKQLAQRLPGLVKGLEKEIASFRGIDPNKFNIFEAVEKKTVKLSEFMAGFENFLPKWAKLGESMGDAYSSAVARLSNAWTDLLVKISTSDAGKSIIAMIEKMTKDLQNDDITRVVNDVVRSFATISKTLMNIAEYIVPQIGRALRNLPFVGLDKQIAESSPTAFAAAQMSTSKMSNFTANYQTQGLIQGLVSTLSQGISDTLGLEFLSGGYINPAGSNKIDLAERLAADFSMEDIGNLFAEGWLRAGEKGTLEVSKTAREQFDKSLLESATDLSTLVFDPLVAYLVSVDGDISKIDKKIRQAQEARSKATGIQDSLSIETQYMADTVTVKEPQQIPTMKELMPVSVAMSFSLEDSTEKFKEEVAKTVSITDEEAKDYTFGVSDKIAEQFSHQLSISLATALTDVSDSLPSFDRVLNVDGFMASVATQRKATPADYVQFDKQATEKAATPEQQAAVAAEIERLKGEVAGLQAEGNYAKQKALVYMKDKVGDIKDDIRKGATPEQKAEIDALRNEMTNLKAAAIDKQASQEMDTLKAEIEGKLLSGRLKNQLKTQYDDLIKWQLTTENKIADKFTGMGWDTSGMSAQIKQAVEVMSQEALTQGNTPMEIITKAEKRAAEGRVDAWRTTYKELVTLMSNYNALQIDSQFELMQIEDGISGERIEKEKKRIREAAEENKKNFKNTKLQDEIAQITQLSKDMELLQNRQNFFGGMFDAAGTEEAAIAMDKLQAQLDAIVKEYGSSVPVMKEFGRLQQEINDKVIDKKISNASSFTEYLNIRLSKEQGLFDNNVVATQKQFEKMYEAVGGGAVEMGTTIEKSFTDAFTGTLKSWGDVWKEIQAIFLKTLASMIWEAKARPIVIGTVSALTGVPALASAAGGSDAAKLAGALGNNGQSGIFSTLSKGFDKFTKSVDDFGKNTMKLTGDLSDYLGAGILGAAVGGMFNGTSGAIGGSVGGVVGNVVGTALKDTLLKDTLGEMAPGIGQVIGTVAGTLLSKAFFGGTRVTDNGIKVTIDEKGLEKAFTYVKTKNDSWIGGGSKISYSEMDSSLYRQINSQIQSSFSTISRQMLSLGLTSNFSGFSVDEKVSLKGSDPEAMLKAWLNKLAGKMVDTAMGNEALLANFSAVKKAGETSSETLERLVTSLAALQEGALSANVSVEKLAGGLSGLDLAAYASDLSDALGGTSGVSAFFSRIEKFIGYAGTEGIQNITMMSDKFQTAIDNINGFSGESGTRTSVLQEQMSNLEYTKADLENKLTKFASGGGWSQWLSFDGNNLNMTGKGGFTSVEEMMNASPKWKEQLTPIVAYVEELKNTNAAITSVSTKLEREANLPSTTSIYATSSTFWADYQKALESVDGMTPEMVAAWDAAAQVAESMADMRDKAEEARKELEELNATYNRQRETLGDAAKIFRVSSSALWEVSYQAQNMNQSDLPAWFEESGNALVEKLVPGLAQFIRVGETALDTVERLTNVFKDTNEAASLAGTSLEAISGANGLGAANYAQELVDYFGSQDNVNAIFSAIGDAIYDDEGLSSVAVSYWEAQATAQAEALGTTVDDAKNFLKEKMSQTITDPAILNSYSELATSLNNMEAAASSASESVDSLTEYLEDIKDKIAVLGMTDTEEFLYNLKKEVADMEKEILSRGGSEQDAALAKQYGSASVFYRLKDTMDTVYDSIEKLSSSELDYQWKQLITTYLEQARAAKLLGATQEELTAIMYDNYLQGKEILQEALNNARNDYLDALKKEIDTKQEAIDAIQESVDKLTNFIESLQDLKDELATSAGFLSPSEAAGVSLSQFKKTALLAKSGDETAMANLSSQATQALSAAESGSYQEYISTFVQVYGAVNSLQKEMSATKTPQQVQMDLLTESRDSLQAIYDQLQEDADTTKTVADAQAAYLEAQKRFNDFTFASHVEQLKIEEENQKETVGVLERQYDVSMSLLEASDQYKVMTKLLTNISDMTDASYIDSSEQQRVNNKIYSTLTNLEDFLTPEATKDGSDSGIKTIVSATSIKDGVLLAIRSSNDTDTVPATSLIGLLNTIKTNTTVAKSIIGE